MTRKFTKANELKEGYWVILRLMRLAIKSNPATTHSAEFARVSHWLMDRMTFDAFDAAVRLLEEEERNVR